MVSSKGIKKAPPSASWQTQWIGPNLSSHSQLAQGFLWAFCIILKLYWYSNPTSKPLKVTPIMQEQLNSSQSVSIFASVNGKGVNCIGLSISLQQLFELITLSAEIVYVDIENDNIWLAMCPLLLENKLRIGGKLC